MEECLCDKCMNRLAESILDKQANKEVQEVIELTTNELEKVSACKRVEEVSNWICGTKDDGYVLAELEELKELLSGVADLAEQAIDYDSKEKMSDALAKIAQLLY